jgi:hypothetical protein
MAFPPQLPGGQYLPTTPSYTLQEIYEATGKNTSLQNVFVKVYQDESDILQSLNNKITGLYTLEEYQTGALYFANPAYNSTTANRPMLRNVFRKTINTGQLANTGTTIIPHNFNCNSAYTLVFIGGAATDNTGLNYISLPYASPTLASNIEVRADATNIYITTGSNRSNFNLSQIVLEFIKS